MGIVEQCLLQLNSEKRRWRKMVLILTALSLVVALFTVWNLRMTGVTIANSATCGYEEHQHSEECPQEKLLICEISNFALSAHTIMNILIASIDSWLQYGVVYDYRKAQEFGKEQKK